MCGPVCLAEFMDWEAAVSHHALQCKLAVLKSSIKFSAAYHTRLALPCLLKTNRCHVLNLDFLFI